MIRVEVGAHTDARSSDDYNQALSERRAQSVVTWLIGQGISAARLASRGYGETKPVADNETDEGRAPQRRRYRHSRAGEKPSDPEIRAMITIPAFLCFAFVSLACGTTVPLQDVPKPTGTLMEFREVNDSTCFLRIKVCGDSVSGFYVEHGQNMDDEKIYYAAVCQDLKFSGTAISFVLREYAWSRKPMESVQGEITREDVHLGTVPALAQFANYFRGELGDSTLALSRISDIYDSRVDVYTYTVSRTPCDCP